VPSSSFDLLRSGSFAAACLTLCHAAFHGMQNMHLKLLKAARGSDDENEQLSLDR
jgi:hypothetical protein